MAKPELDMSEFFDKGKKECIAARLIAKLPQIDQDKIALALEDVQNIDGMSIVRYMQRRGVDAKHPALIRHRKKECICGK